MKMPKRSYLETIYRVVRNLKASVGQDIQLKNQTNTDLFYWCDSAWAASPNISRYVTGHVVQFSDYLVSWKSKKQHILSRSLGEAEYRSIASAVAELTWLEGLFTELNMYVHKPITLFSDSKSVIQLATNSIIHERTKYIEIDYQFIKDKIQNSLVQTLHVSSQHQVANMLTKSSGHDQHSKLLSKFGVVNIIHPSA